MLKKTYNPIKCCKHIICISLGSMFIISSSLFTFLLIQNKIENKIEETFKSNTYKTIKQNILFLKKGLIAQALTIVLNDNVLKAYKKDDPIYLYKKLKPIWEVLHNYFNIYEMHFFKYPLTNFLAFSTGSTKAFYARVRADIKFIESSNKVASYFFVCKKFAGLRATFPIKVENKILGALSYGVEMDFIKNVLNKNLNMPTFYILNKTILKQNLAANSYQKYLSKASKEKDNLLYFYINQTFSLKDLKKGTKEINSKIYIFYPLLDYKGKPIGYIGAYKNFFFLFRWSTYTFLLSFIIGTISLAFLIFVLIRFNLYLGEKLEETLSYLKLLKYGYFEELAKVLEKNRSSDYIFGNIQKSILEISQNLKTYFNTLEKELQLQINKGKIDTLTKLYNRRVLEDLKNKLEKFPKDYPYSLIMLDIDHFKKINDNYGHLIGDKVLAKLGEIIKNCIRQKDIPIRYGGEEFLIFLPKTSLETAKSIAERLRKTIENLEIPIDKNNVIKFTVSLGVTHKKPGETLKEVIKRADKALYISKRRGRNKTTVL